MKHWTRSFSKICLENDFVVDEARILIEPKWKVVSERVLSWKKVGRSDKNGGL